MKKTIVFVTHDIQEAMKLGDRICILKDGQVLQVGTPEELLQNPVNEFVHHFVGSPGTDVNQDQDHSMHLSSHTQTNFNLESIMTPIAPGHVPKSAKTAVPISMTLTDLLDVLDAYDTLLVEKNHQIVGQVSRTDMLRYWSGQLQERVRPMSKFSEVFTERKGQLLTALLEHVQISFIALFLAVLIAIPLGIYLTRKPKAAEPIIGVTAILQTIPSLALLGLLIPLFGIGTVPAIIALVVYALLPILRNTYTGITEVDPSMIEAANAMGMNSRQRLSKVELPLAMPVIMAGIRTAMVLIVGTATLAALIGAGGLGDLILLGIDRNDTALIMLGAIPAALLAILFDVLLRQFQRMSFRKTVATLSTLALIAILVITLPLLFRGGQKDLVIAGKLGAEPEILINMYKLLIEEHTDLTVELKPGLGKTPFV